MAHTFIEHIAGKVIQRIVLTDDPMLTKSISSSRTELHFTFSWTSRCGLNSWNCGTGKMATAGSSRNSCEILLATFTRYAGAQR
jgi:hypothetical protein